MTKASKTTNSILQAILLLAAATACTGSEQSAYTTIDPDGWIYGDTVYFTPLSASANPDADSDTVVAIKGDLNVVIRHNNNYEYQNIWLEMHYSTPDTTVTDTLNVQLADAFGTWLGKGMGVSYQLSAPVLHSTVIDAAKPVKLTHIMRTDTLADIEQVGMVFMPSHNQTDQK